MEPISFSCWRSKGTSVSCSWQRSAKEVEATAEETEGGGSKVEATEERVSFEAWISLGCWRRRRAPSPQSGQVPQSEADHKPEEKIVYDAVHNRVVCSASGSWVWKTRYGLFSVYIVWQIFLYSIYQFFPAELSSFDWPKNLTDLRFKYLSTDV